MLNSLAAPHLIPTGLYTESPARDIVQFVTGPVGPPDARRGYCLDSNTAADLVRVRRPAFSMSVPLGRRWVRARERRSLPQNNGAGMAELLIKELIASVDLQRLSSAPNALPGNDRTSLMLHRDAAPGYWRHPDTRACPPKTAALPDPATGKRGRGAADWVARTPRNCHGVPRNSFPGRGGIHPGGVFETSAGERSPSWIGDSWWLCSHCSEAGKRSLALWPQSVGARLLRAR